MEEELFARRRRERAALLGTAAAPPVLPAAIGERPGRRPEGASVRPTHWSVVWSDLMMTMFILFSVLYVYQLSQREFLQPESIGGVEPASVLGQAPEGDLSTTAGPLAQVYDIGRRVITETDLGDFADISLAPDKTVRIVLTGDVLFDSDDAELKPAARSKLRKIAELLRLNPYVINVVGHTDNVPVHSPRFPSNWELSVLRATAVTRFLIHEGGVPAERFYVTGHGYFQPVAPNDSIANRAKNRRVEIIVTRDMPGARYLPGTSNAF